MPNILVVDDLEIDRLLVQGILEKKPGITVIHADNGVEALQRLDEWDIDLVITDLQMPEMDGLELLDHVRQQHSNIPVILMTGAGSEEVAARALLNGAAGYIPKSHVDSLIVSTVKNALDILYADRGFAQLASRAFSSKMEFVVDSDPSNIQSLVDLFGKLLAGLPEWDRVQRLRFSVAVEQALTNAVYRGNLEIPQSRTIPYSGEALTGDLADLVADQLKAYGTRRVSINLGIDGDWLKLSIQDQGPGFSPDLDAVDFGSAGRGLTLINAFIDDVSFNNVGNEIVLKHRLSTLTEQSHPTNEEKNEDDLGLGQLIAADGVIHLEREKLVIGRRSTSHIVLPFKNVSAHHCKLLLKDGMWYVKDLGSANGITVNGSPKEVAQLLPGDKLGIAGLEFEIQYRVPQKIRT